MVLKKFIFPNFINMDLAKTNWILNSCEIKISYFLKFVIYFYLAKMILPIINIII